ncbi:MAG: transporter substrate-binding domain-containing protein [Pseudonocardia sp.]|nr:transporter substrate-binding domain-containing protein [Pseudonocardia sp.]
MLTRRRLLLGLPVLAAVSCAQRSGTTLEQARRWDVLRVGISGERPYGYVNARGQVTGSQPEVARAVLARIGVGGLEAVQVRFDELIPGLLADQFDLITAGMMITAGRCAEVAFSRPDFVALPAFLVPEGNPRGIHTYGGVAQSGTTLAVLGGSVELLYARAAGVSEDQLKIADSQRSLFRDVVSGRVQAGALTAISLADELRRNPGLPVEITRPVEPTIDGRAIVPAAAFAARPGETDLLTAFDAELTALQASGEWLRIVEPFGLSAVNLPDPDLSTAELCAPM